MYCFPTVEIAKKFLSAYSSIKSGMKKLLGCWFFVDEFLFFRFRIKQRVVPFIFVVESEEKTDIEKMVKLILFSL